MSSRTIAYQTTDEDRLRNRFHTHLEQDGGNPSQLLEMLELIISKKLWETYSMGFHEFIEKSYEHGGLGWSIENLETILKLQHRFEHENTGHKELREKLKTMRQQIMDLLHDPSNPVGRPTTEEKLLHCNNFAVPKKMGNSASEALRRLKRHRPDLATKVITGELSANAAAIEAGFRHPPHQLSHNPTTAGRYLAKKVDRAWLDAMIDAYDTFAALSAGEAQK